MKLFEEFYKECVPQFQKYFTNVNYNINENKFQHKFLVNNQPCQINITFPECSENITLSISQWIYDNPFLFSRLMQNEVILKNYLKRNGLVPKTNEVTFDAPCCNKLCIHALYSFYCLDKIIDENPGLLLTLCGINIDFIMNKLADSLVRKTINNSSDRILGEEALNCIIGIEWE